MEIITGYTGKPHVTSEQDRDVNIGVVGEGSYVLQTGMQLATEVSSNNEIKIRDGVLMHQGCTASIKKNTYDSLIIINGSQGMKRIDLIVARYEKNQDNGIESLDLKVIQGTPAESTPTVPEYTEGDIQAGDYVADMPMYQVIIDGLNITEVKKVFEVAPGIDAMKKEIAELNSKTMNLEYASVKRRVDAATLAVGKEYTFEQDCYVYFGASFTSTSGYCRVYVTNENDEIVHYVQINPAPISANAQTTHEYFAKKWWKIKTGSYGSLYNNVISYSLIY